MPLGCEGSSPSLGIYFSKLMIKTNIKSEFKTLGKNLKYKSTPIDKQSKNLEYKNRFHLNLSKVNIKQNLIKLRTLKGLLFIIIVLQVITLLSVYNPIEFFKNIQNQLLINEVLSKAKNKYPDTEIPVVATVSDIDQLKSSNVINEQVYKDAKNGDIVLVYNDNIIIYRKDEGKVIYEGDSPSIIEKNNQQILVNNIIKLAKSEKLISEDSNEIPQLSVIADPDQLRNQSESNKEFYKLARKNDIIVIFSDAGKIAVYNSDSQSFVTSANFSTTYQKV